MQFTDTHCHLQFEKYDDPVKVVDDAQAAGVSRMICVGTSLEDSQKAIGLSAKFKGVWPSAGLHPHEASDFLADHESQEKFLDLLNKPSVVAVGEVGLDYYRNYSPKEDQLEALKILMDVGSDSGLPFIFHIRDAWEDFWPIFDSHPGLRGVIHSFSATTVELEQILRRGLHVGLNGIMTFTNDQKQLEAAKRVPLDRLLLETDAPFLTPKPHRGHLCEPKHVVDVAKFLAELRGEPLQELAEATTANAAGLFNLEAKNG